MKRFVLLFLLTVLPLQITWAGVASCPPGAHHEAHASEPGNAAPPDDGHSHGDGSRPDDSHRHGDGSDAHHGHLHGDHGTSGHAGESVLDCSLFHFVAVEPLAATAQSPGQPGVSVADIGYPGHKSHIPDGPERPNWRPAA